MRYLLFTVLVILAVWLIVSFFSCFGLIILGSVIAAGLATCTDTESPKRA